MKIISQIPLLIFVLIAYAVIAFANPSWLNIRQNPAALHPATVSAAPAGTPETVDTSTATTADDDLDLESAQEDLFSGTTEKPVFLMKLVSGATWGMTLGEILISSALFLLFIEIFKSTRPTQSTIIDHILSTFVFMLYLVLFVAWDRAGTGVFFILMLISLVDIMCGFTVSIASARRDVSFASE